ncbi:hypothetical protein GLOIN_2v1618092 [Rhizophagus irregularis DAOM 181602=DAOM 197198]|nr:hypothetical protein GLOIN_2v1618092 [Rhizophagus irregularis DAOM 181602=DAOM 197198]
MFLNLSCIKIKALKIKHYQLFLFLYIYIQYINNIYVCTILLIFLFNLYSNYLEKSFVSTRVRV